MSSFRDKFLYKFFPQKLYEKKTYSQYGEDLLIIACINMLNLKNVKYIDIGSNHPYHLNNTALLHKMGFSGINIEPNEVLFKEFIKFRKNDINLNIGIGLTNGLQDFYLINPNTLSTFSKSEALNYEKQGYEIISNKKISTETIDYIIKKYNKNVFPEVLSIDIEGLDYQILESIDLTENYPKIICVETCRFTTDSKFENKNNSLINLLLNKGYKVFADTFINTILFKP